MLSWYPGACDSRASGRLHTSLPCVLLNARQWQFLEVPAPCQARAPASGTRAVGLRVRAPALNSRRPGGISHAHVHVHSEGRRAHPKAGSLAAA